MFENIMRFFKKAKNKEGSIAISNSSSKDTAKERLHLVLMQDRANVSADFLDLMRQEIVEVIKKYIDIDEASMDVRLTNKENDDGTKGAPALYANIPILNIKDETRKLGNIKEKEQKTENKKENPPKKEANSLEEKKVNDEKSQENTDEEKNKETVEEEQKIQKTVEEKKAVNE